MRIPFKSKLANIKDIPTRNKKFWSLTKKQQRREIAYDSLNLVRLGYLGVSSYGYWFGFDGLEQIQSSHQMQDFMLNKLRGVFCTVCQRGAVMVSQIRLGNKITPDNPGLTNGRYGASKSFGRISMVEMEGEYEGSLFDTSYASNTREKICNMMCNIIVNGDFKGKDRTDYLRKWGIKIQPLK